DDQVVGGSRELACDLSYPQAGGVRLGEKGTVDAHEGERIGVPYADRITLFRGETKTVLCSAAQRATARRRVAEEDAREVVPGLLNVQGPPVPIDREPDVGIGQVPVCPAQLLEASATK